MLSKKEVFIQQIEILERQLLSGDVLMEGHFKNDVELLFIMLCALVRDIKDTKTPLKELVELNEKVLGELDLDAIPLDELITLLKEAFEPTERLKERLKLGCLNYAVSESKKIKQFINNVLPSLNKSMLNQEELSSFVLALHIAFHVDLVNVATSTTNEYSDIEKKNLAKISKVASYRQLLNQVHFHGDEEDMNIMLSNLFDDIQKIDFDWLSKISE